MSESRAIEIVNIVPLKEESPYLKPLRMHYRQNGKTLTWDCIKTHDSVAILIFNTSRNVLVFVRQFRPPVLLSTLFNNRDLTLDNYQEKSKQLNQLKIGYTLELCAGIIDKQGLSPQEIAKEEIIEETGYSPPLESVQLITSFRTGVGTSGSLQYLYYCEVNDSMRVSQGGGVDDESIEVIELNLDESRKQIYACDEATGLGRTPGLRFALSWFIYEKYPSLTQEKTNEFLIK